VRTLFSGITSEGVLILNSPAELQARPDHNVKLAGIINARQIALEEMGRDVPNTCLVGALAATTDWVTLESIIASLPECFGGDKLNKNIRCTERGYREVKIQRWQ